MQPETAFVGVTHDVSLAPGASRAAVCRCLAVAYGSPNDARFAWAAAPTSSIPLGLSVVAIAADGVTCDASGYDPRRASIAGIERKGDDVVVTVEHVAEGHPVMRGAFIAPPGPKGALVLQALAPAPFGASSDGSRGPCRVTVR
jgi:hypothetical protein